MAPPDAPGPIVRAEGLGKTYRRGLERIAALGGVTLALEPGAFCCLLGPAGAGKTTLLNLLGAMDVPSEGSLSVCGASIAADGRTRLGESERDRLRRTHIGFVFTEFFLIPTLTALENVELPHLWSGKHDRPYALSLLERVGLSHRIGHRPAEMSGGEMQRVAIARALANRPRLLLADEPTGNVDTRTRDSLFSLFRELNADGLTVVVATHDTELARRFDRTVVLDGGQVIEGGD